MRGREQASQRGAQSKDVHDDAEDQAFIHGHSQAMREAVLETAALLEANILQSHVHPDAGLSFRPPRNAYDTTPTCALDALACSWLMCGRVTFYELRKLFDRLIAHH